MVGEMSGEGGKGDGVVVMVVRSSVLSSIISLLYLPASFPLLSLPRPALPSLSLPFPVLPFPSLPSCFLPPGGGKVWWCGRGKDGVGGRRRVR